MKDLSGTWTGYYEYGLNYPLPYFGKRVQMTLELDFTNDNIFGTSKEEKSQFSVPAEGKIKGYKDENLISFVKKYPIRPMAQEDGTIQLLDGSIEVNHTGYYDEKYNSIYGLWTINTPISSPLDNYEDTQYEGIWLIKKE